MALSDVQLRNQITMQKVQREMQRSPLPSRFSVPFDKRLRNPLDGNPTTNKDMTVDGSSTPVVFDHRPTGNEAFAVNYVTIFIVHDGAFLPGEFGSLGAALTNGIEIKCQQNGIPHTMTLILTNADILQCFGGAVGIAGPGTGANVGVFNTPDWLAGKYMLEDKIMLFGDTGDFIQIAVNDNLTGLDFLQSSIRKTVIEI